MNQPKTQNRPRLTDSPWYWLYLYCTFGLIALVIAGPKIAQRQLQAEQNLQGRQRANQQAAGEPTTVPLATLENRSVNLWPLFLVLGILVCVGWISLWYRHFYRRIPAAAAAETSDP